MGLKVAVIGGGSTYTPELVDGFARRGERLPIDELVLFDISTERLDIVGGLVRRMLDHQGWPGRLVLTDDRDRALEGADFVLIQLRVGGQAARLVDESLPPTFGVVGQETTGAGGFAKALRTVPVVLDLAEAVGRNAAPGAWIVDFTNPVGIVTQALLDAGHHALGLCNVAINVQRALAERFGVTPDRVEIEHVGLNHLSWVRAVRVDGEDRLPGLLDDDEGAAWAADHVGLSVERIRDLGAIPSYYLRYYDDTARVVASQRDGHTRAGDVMDIEGRLLELYRDPALHEKPALLADRGGAFYSEAAAQLMASLHDGRGDVQVVDTRNDGALPDLPADAVVEVPARIDRAGAHPLPLEPLAPELHDLVTRVKAYERLAIDAATTGDRSVALAALEANPLVADRKIAEPLLGAFLEANHGYLPRFFDRPGATVSRDP
jgi:6-phospho-beta-glucosidase